VELVRRGAARSGVHRERRDRRRVVGRFARGDGAARDDDAARFDRVLGGGLVPGAVVLLGGEPGIGKSTLLLQAGRGVARSGEVLYATGEESAAQVRLRGERLGIREPRLLVAAETDVASIVALAEKRAAALLIVDSIQAVRDGASPRRRERCRRCARRRSSSSGSRNGPASRSF
jgi:DNA repair protein RadA/Sms